MLAYVLLLEIVLILSSSAESGPFFIIEPSPATADVGTTVEFECSVEGTPQPRVLWYKDSSLIMYNNQRLHMKEIQITYSHRKLIIMGVRHAQDSGFYSCQADNKLGIIRSRNAQLKIPYFSQDKPHFLKTPKASYSNSPGHGQIMPCSYDTEASWPPPTITWSKRKTMSDRFEDVEIGLEKFVSLTGTMVFTKTKFEDEGIYRCNAINIKTGDMASTDQTKFTIERGAVDPAVEGRIYVAAPYIDVKRDSTAVLECIPYGNPVPKIIWSRENQPILPTKSETMYDGRRLIIPSFNRDDAGNYVCEAIQGQAKVNRKTINVTLLEPPEFDIPAQNLTLVEGSTLAIPCKTSGYPAPTITWLKNSEEINTNVASDGTLTLTDGIAITSGMYQCHVENEVGSAQATFAVKVIGEAKITSNSEPKVVSQGTNVTLTCEAKGSPVPSIVWLKDGQGLDRDTRIRFQETLYLSTIHISNIQLTDNGVYECHAVNDHGEDQMRSEINVRGPPFINLSPVDTVGITGTDILVRCEARSYPSPKITWYRNEAKLEASLKYVFEKEGLRIKNVAAVDGGSFQCQATNSIDKAVSKPVQVTVYNNPKIFPILPPTTNVTAGRTSLLLPCGITKDYSQYIWHKNGIPLLSTYFGDNMTPRVESRKGIGLYFFSVLPEDQGFYSCNVSNPASKTSTSGYLFVDVMPSISYISPSIQIREREGFLINCVYEGMPKPQLTWHHNNAPITRQHYIYPNGTLRITDSTRTDSGAYQCIVSNRQGSKKKDTIVTVKSKARIENLPTYQNPITGQRSTIICDVSGHPYPTVEWYYLGAMIDSIKSYKLGFQKSGSNLIILRPDRAKHDGLYTCNARNDFGFEEQITTVQVLDFPVINKVEGCGPVTASNECKMTCKASGVPLPSLSWRYKEGNVSKIVMASDRLYVSLLDNQQGTRELSFTIRKLRADDSRTYYCHAENPAGMTTMKYDLRVRYASIINNPPLVNYEFPIGATLTMSCGAIGEPKPSILWDKTKGLLPPNGRSKILDNGSLVIINVQIEDQGQYTCTASNNGENYGFSFDPVSVTTSVKVNSDQQRIIDNPVETWLIVVIIICVVVVCIVVFVSVKMIRDKAKEKRSYKPHSVALQKGEEPTYQFEPVRPKQVLIQVPVDTTNSLPMYDIRTLNKPNKLDSQFDDVDKQLQGLLKDLDGHRDPLESDI